jgi:hypothetical protein
VREVVEKEATLRMKEQQLARREEQLAEQRRVLTEEYRLFHTSQSRPAARPAFDGRLGPVSGPAPWPSARPSMALERPATTTVARTNREQAAPPRSGHAAYTPRRWSAHEPPRRRFWRRMKDLLFGYSEPVMEDRS